MAGTVAGKGSARASWRQEVESPFLAQKVYEHLCQEHGERFNFSILADVFNNFLEASVLPSKETVLRALQGAAVPNDYPRFTHDELSYKAAVEVHTYSFKSDAQVIRCAALNVRLVNNGFLHPDSAELLTKYAKFQRVFDFAQQWLGGGPMTVELLYCREQSRMDLKFHSKPRQVSILIRFEPGLPEAVFDHPWGDDVK